MELPVHFFPAPTFIPAIAATCETNCIMGIGSLWAPPSDVALTMSIAQVASRTSHTEASDEFGVGRGCEWGMAVWLALNMVA
jgi:hypothetical protein